MHVWVGMCGMVWVGVIASMGRGVWGGVGGCDCMYG